MRSSFRSLAATLAGGGLAALAVVLLVPGGATTTRTVAATTRVAANALASAEQTHETLAHEIYAQAAPSVVAISATSQPGSAFGGAQGDTGSGVVVSAKGLVLTN